MRLIGIHMKFLILGRAYVIYTTPDEHEKHGENDAILGGIKVEREDKPFVSYSILCFSGGIG